MLNGDRTRKTERLSGMISPSNLDTTLTPNHGYEHSRQATPFVTAHAAAILRTGLSLIAIAWRKHPNAILSQLLARLVTIVGAVTNHILGLGLNHLQIKTQSQQNNFMAGRRIGTDRQRQTALTDNCHIFHALSPADGRINKAPPDAPPLIINLT